MIEATLSFAREQASGEANRMVDVGVLTESNCADPAESSLPNGRTTSCVFP